MDALKSEHLWELKADSNHPSGSWKLLKVRLFSGMKQGCHRVQQRWVECVPATIFLRTKSSYLLTVTEKKTVLEESNRKQALMTSSGVCLRVYAYVYV